MEVQEYKKRLMELLEECEIKESNRLIAEFMGKAPYINKDGGYEYMVAENFPISSSDLEGVWYHLHFTFDHDWNALMEVVEKITTTNEFQEYEFNSLFWEIFCKIDINEVYIQVVIFIKWYNENK